MGRTLDIVFATCAVQPDISTSDRVLATALERRGATVTGAPWNAGFEPFVQADAVIIRTTWDYFDHYPEFCAWLDSLEYHNVSLLNPLAMLRWTIHKSYLFELKDGGAPVLPMVAVTPDVDAIQRAAKERDWGRAVLKCLVSGTARGLSLFDTESEEQIQAAIKFAEPWSQHGLVVQPFMPQITESGELSMVFIDGRFTHAVCKMPKPNEFRIQSEFGGQYTRVEPVVEHKNTARQCLDHAERILGAKPLYARVDGLLVNGVFQLMELELAEPELMFNLAPDAADAMAAAVMQRLG